MHPEEDLCHQKWRGKYRALGLSEYRKSDYHCLAHILILHCLQDLIKKRSKLWRKKLKWHPILISKYRISSQIRKMFCFLRNDSLAYSFKSALSTPFSLNFRQAVDMICFLGLWWFISGDLVSRICVQPPPSINQINQNLTPTLRQWEFLIKHFYFGSLSGESAKMQNENLWDCVLFWSFCSCSVTLHRSCTQNLLTKSTSPLVMRSSKEGGSRSDREW